MLSLPTCVWSVDARDVYSFMHNACNGKTCHAQAYTRERVRTCATMNTHMHMHMHMHMHRRISVFV